MNSAIFSNYDGIKVNIYDVIIRKFHEYDETVEVDTLFPDRLRNMQGYEYQMVAVDTIYRIKYEENSWFGPDKLLMDVLTKQQNATYAIANFIIGGENSFRPLDRDLFLNTYHSGGPSHLRHVYKTVNTFDTDGYCALIPAPSRMSYLKYLLTPFDAYIWIYTLTTMTIFTIIWRIFKKRATRDDFDSASHFVFGMIALFFLQAIPFRRNRPILTSVTQLFVFTLMILGNVYQSLLISLISEPHFESKISTVDEMIERYNKFRADIVFIEMMDESKTYPTMVMETTDLVELMMTEEIVAAYSANRTVFITKCTALDYVNSMSNITKVLMHYYVLSQKFYSSYEKFLSGFRSPFNDRMNDISLQIFETGVRQHWKTLSTPARRDYDIEEDNMLKLSDLAGVFSIFGICIVLSAIVFIAEFLQFRWRERGAPSFLKRIGQRFGLKKRKYNMESRLGKVILEPINLDDLNDSGAEGTNG